MSERLDLGMDQVFKWYKEKRLFDESHLKEQQDEEEEEYDETESSSRISTDTYEDNFKRNENNDFQIDYEYDE